MTEFDKILIGNFNKGLNYLLQLDKERLIEQGHVATGRLKDSLRVEVKFDGRTLVGEFKAMDYGRYVDSGVPASRIRYPIDAIKDWIKVIEPSMNGKERNSFAWAIWAKHKKEGMPTNASRRFSKSGKRTDWIKDGTKIAEDKFDELFQFTQWILSLFTHSVEAFKKV